MNQKILTPTSNHALNLALDTIGKEKQALIFASSKRSAEKIAEDISKKIKNVHHEELSQKALRALGKPTTQCERLAKCLAKGVAFHHAGLASKQKELIEENFRKGIIKIIGCTPTLAAGLNLPAFRVIIKDYKRYSGRFGMKNIPVLEYHQMAGRCGRPGHDEYGEALLISTSEAEKEGLHEEYVLGEAEEITSKLNVEPVMRTYLLSLISAKIFRTHDEIIEFFKDTFWAHQYQDMPALEKTIDTTLQQLQRWKFIETKNDVYYATQIGRRVAELYLDPYTAEHLIRGIKRATSKQLLPLSFVQLACNTIEMWPLLNVKTAEFNDIQEKTIEWESNLLTLEPNPFDIEYDDWLRSIKTSMMFLDWTEEKTEQDILKTYNVRPGELHGKLRNIEWLLYGTTELAQLLNCKEVVSHISKLRYRLKNGVKEELLPLLKLKQIGRMRARTLFRAGAKNPRDLKRFTAAELAQLIGPTLAKNILKQVGREKEKIMSTKKKETGTLKDYS